MALRKPAEKVALLGAGIFARDAHAKVLQHLQEELELCYVWSKSQSSAEKLVLEVKEWSPSTEALWGEEGLNKFLNCSPDVSACIIVLPIQIQPKIVKMALAAGKHVLQEKPIGPSVAEALSLMSYVEDLKPSCVWAVAENFRFEPALHRAAQHVKSLGRMTVFHVAIEVAMTEQNRYFHSQWRRDPHFTGAFILDCGVHYVAALRLLTGQQVASLSAFASHRDADVPPPDNLTASLLLDNGCTGTFSVSFSSCANKMSWRVVCRDGSVEVARGASEGRFGFTVLVTPRRGEAVREFFPFAGVDEELKAFAADVGRYNARSDEGFQADWKGSPSEALEDLKVIEAALHSGMHGNGALIVSEWGGAE